MKNERLGCEIKVSLGTILCFIGMIRGNYTRSYDIQIFFYPYVGVIFYKYILSKSEKLADADPTST